MMHSFETYLEKSIHVLKKLDSCWPNVEEAIRVLCEAFKKGKKVLVCGNGGSSSDAAHLSTELVGRFLKNRRALAVIDLSSNSATLTALANDFGYDTVFSRQVEAYGCDGDVLIGLSTSGRSPNVMNAFELAQSRGIRTIAFTGETQTSLHEKADVSIRIPSTSTPLIQQAHLVIYHFICGKIEETLV